MNKYIVYDPGYWQPIFRGHCYRNSAITIEYAAKRMSGNDEDLRSIQREEIARKLIWC